MANGERQWATAVLRKLGKQPNERNVSNLVGWARAEGGHTHNDARYNYLNTTQPMPGAGNTGTQGNIKVYRSLQQGVDATVRTLKNGRYGGIVSALDSSPDRLAAAIGSSPWGTHNPNLASIIASAKASPAASGSTYGSSATQTPSSASSVTPSAATSGTKQAALQQYLLTERQDPNALLTLAAATQGTASEAPSGDPAAVDSSASDVGKAPTNGAASALAWVSSKLGDPNSRESAGENQGGLASYANKQFGMSGAPWCAMFTSMAVVKGGAPASARTASVAQVRAKARAKQGYRGFVNPAQAKPGDLVLFGNSHIAMVQSVKGNTIHYIGGNQSDNVTEGTTSTGSVDVVRPAYAK